MKIEGLENGEYIINLILEAKEDTSVSSFENHRRFMVRNLQMKKGEIFSGRFAVSLKDADFQKQENYRDTAIEIVTLGSCHASVKIEKSELPTIFCLGDSTVCDQIYYGGRDTERCCGWGQTLGMFLSEKYCVSNHAEQGTHTADCLNCHIKPVLKQIKRGDKVLVQFGHNDQKQEYLKPWEGYRENLIKTADAISNSGAECILCTPINRLIYVDGKLNDYLEEYSNAVRDVCETKKLRCIDLNKFTSETYLSLGKEAENLFFHSESGLDRTHPNDNGGTLIGKYVAESI
jgi:lysophospholipase L1-like esterase